MSKTLAELQQELVANPDTAVQSREDWAEHVELSVKMSENPASQTFLNRRRELHEKGIAFLFSSTRDGKTYFSTFPEYGESVEVEDNAWDDEEEVDPETPMVPKETADKLYDENVELKRKLNSVGIELPEQYELNRMIASQEYANLFAQALHDQQTGNVEGIDALVRKDLLRLIAKDAAEKKFNALNSPTDFAALEGDLSLKELKKDEENLKTYWRFENLMIQGHITNVAAVRKAGKSTFAINRLKSYCDGGALFGLFPVIQPEGRVLYMNYELQKNQLGKWLNSLEIENDDKLDIMNLRGKNYFLQYPEVQDHLIKYLIDHDIEILEIDPLQSALIGDTSNESVANEFAAAVNRIKESTGVKDVILTTHMGKAGLGADSDNATSMGASKWEGWPDNIIYFKRVDNSDISEIHIKQGRDVQLEPTRLIFDKDTYLMSYHGTKEDHEKYERSIRITGYLNALPEDWTEQNDWLDGLTKNSKYQSEFKKQVADVLVPFGMVSVESRKEERGKKFIKRGPKWENFRVTREDPSKYALFIVQETRKIEAGEAPSF